MLRWRSVDPELLEPLFRQDIENLFGSDVGEWYVLWGYRSIQTSNRMHEDYLAGRGPRAAPGGSSPHNYGLAVDVVPDNEVNQPGLQPEWRTDAPSWVRIRSLVDAHARLHGGWKFTTGPKDWDHIERVDWQTYKSWRTDWPSLP